MPPLPYYDLFILARTALSQPCFMTLNSMHAVCNGGKPNRMQQGANETIPPPVCNAIIAECTVQKGGQTTCIMPYPLYHR